MIWLYLYPENFALDCKWESKTMFQRGLDIFHDCEELNVSKKFDPLHEIDKLRTFLPLSNHVYVSTCYLADNILHDLLPTFKCLRVLSLSYYHITYLPDSFGNLKQLRYLKLSNTNIQKLP